MKTLLSLVVWFVLWEIAGRLKLSTILPPFSAVIEALFDIAPTEKFGKAAIITLRSFGLGMGLALVVMVFLFAFAVSEAIAALERRVEYYAAAR